MQTATPNPADPAAGGVVRVSFAHAGCLPSLVVVDPTVADRHLNPATGHDIVAVRLLRWLAPRALLGWEADRRTVQEQTAGGELRDLLVAHYLQHGWSLVPDDPGTAHLPRLDGWRLAAHRSHVALSAPDGQLAFEVGCPPLAGWVKAVRRERWCGLLTGTTLGLAEGDTTKLLAACRAGRVVGAVVAVARW